MIWTLQWVDSEPHEVLTLEHLNCLLDELERNHDDRSPVLAQLESPGREVLMIGIGGPLSVLDHIAASGWPAMHSVGKPTTETIPYKMGSYYSEMPKSYAISRELARKAIEHFFCAGQLFEGVVWEND